MAVVILMSLPFAVVGYLKPRWWTLVVPYLLWGGLWLLSSLGLRPISSSPGPLAAVIVAGTVGAAIAGIGVVLGRTRRMQLRH